MKYHKGNSGVGIAIAVGIVVIAGIALFWYSGGLMDTDDAIKAGEENMMVEDDHMMDDGGAMEKEDGAMMEAEGDVMMKGETNASFRSAVIAGSSAPLLEFDQRDYEAALASDKLVVLYFYANWCPLCREEFVHTQEAFDQLTTDAVVGFRVHYNDSDVTPAQEQVAREYGVAYQHTKVFIKDGERILKSPEQWDAVRYLAEINAAVAQ